MYPFIFPVLFSYPARPVLIYFNAVRASDGNELHQTNKYITAVGERTFGYKCPEAIYS
jgi:hypothetical protein